MATNDAIARANHLFYEAVRNGRTDTIQTIAAAIWWLVGQQVDSELAGELI
jgi:hypothetical protein